MKKYVFIALLLQTIITGNVLANGITVQKVALSDTNKTAKTVSIKFNIAWENSWRDSINWDAAWIFIKFREPKDSIWRYRHLNLAGTGNTGTGNSTMKFAFPDDKKGVFYYRAGIGSGHIKMDSVKLAWNYGTDNVTNIDSVEVKVFATEMVYIPAGHYSLGDGNGKERSNNSFHLKNAPNNYVVITNQWSPLLYTKNAGSSSFGMDDANVTNDGIRISGEGGLDMNGDKIAEFPDFPTGYRSFYCMKYDVTQGQYADFLNTLSIRDTTNSFIAQDTVRLKKLHPKYKYALQNLDPIFYSTPLDLQRHSISLDTVDGKYIVSRPDRALGKGANSYYLSFSDWSAMRPMSELEFEKTARGPLPPSYKTHTTSNNFSPDTTRSWSGFDWAWGNDTAYARATNNGPGGGNSYSILNYSGLENGTETFSNYNIYKRYINPFTSSGLMGKNVTGGDGGDGPFRVGIFANDTTGRISSGASYYGVMDLSKNVSKLVVSAGQSGSRTLSYKKHGDGILNYQGVPDNNEFLLSNSGPGTTASFLSKTGAVSERNNYGTFIGFRCVRTAPSDN